MARSTNDIDPAEICWYFVEQYYTMWSKSPERTHLFYSKKSQLVTGVEAEKVIPAVGEKVWLPCPWVLIGPLLSLMSGD
jgi:hypothetical protein